MQKSLSELALAFNGFHAVILAGSAFLTDVQNMPLTHPISLFYLALSSRLILIETTGKFPAEAGGWWPFGHQLHAASYWPGTWRRLFTNYRDMVKTLYKVKLCAHSYCDVLLHVSHILGSTSSFLSDRVGRLWRGFVRSKCHQEFFNPHPGADLRLPDPDTEGARQAPDDHWSVTFFFKSRPLFSVISQSFQLSYLKYYNSFPICIFVTLKWFR